MNLAIAKSLRVLSGRLPMLIKSAGDLKAYLLARELVKRGLRTHATGSLTGISLDQIRKIPSHFGLKREGGSGYTPKAATVCRSRMSQIRLSLFVIIYLKSRPDNVLSRIDPEHLIRSFDLVQILAPNPELNLTLAWSLVTELKLGLVELAACSKCKSQFLRIYESSRLPLSCPFCFLQDRRERRHRRLGSKGISAA